MGSGTSGRRFWLPEDGLREKSRPDRVTYDVWAREGCLADDAGPDASTTEFVAAFLWDFCQANDVRRIAFDRWGYAASEAAAREGRLSDEQAGEADGRRSSSRSARATSPCRRRCWRSRGVAPERPACGTAGIRCWRCARPTRRCRPIPAGNRKLSQARSRHGRIDGMVALAMAASVAGTWEATPPLDVLSMIG